MKVCKELCNRILDICDKRSEAIEGYVADVYVTDYSTHPWKKKLLYENAIVFLQRYKKKKEYYIQKPDGYYKLPRATQVIKKVAYKRDVETGICKLISGKCEECD